MSLVSLQLDANARLAAAMNVTGRADHDQERKISDTGATILPLFPLGFV
jgi:hypothetical protein